MIKQNLIVNFIAKCWGIFFSLAFLPLYIKLLGIEAYGLVGAYTSLSMVLSLLFDVGLSTAANREMAIMTASSEDSRAKNNFIRTLEVLYWIKGFAIIAFFYFSSSWISLHWFNASSLSPETIKKAIICMGFSLGALWPFALYNGALLGLEKQVTLNIIVCSFTTLRALGAIFILTFISSSIDAFFIWQSFVNFLQSLVTGFFVWKALPERQVSPKFDLEVLRKVWRFTAGISGVSMTTFILAQWDKILISKLLSLEIFGYYTLAWSISNGLTHFTSPVFSAFFPRFTQHFAKKNEGTLTQLYHQGAQLISCLILPISACLVLFSPEILSVWGINPLMIQETSKLLPLLIIGATLNGLLTMPSILQLSHGWTRLALKQNIIAIFLLIGPLIWAIQKYGALGAACIWVLLNVGYVMISIPIMHRKILKLELKRWYLQDSLIPLLATFSSAAVCRLFLPDYLSRLKTLYFLSFTFIMAFIICIFTAPMIRTQAFRFFRYFTTRKEPEI